MAAAFTTEHGTWLLRIDIDTVRLIRRNMAVDLFDLIRSDRLADLVIDLPALADVVWELIEPTAQRRCIDREAFEASLTGDTLTAMADALVAAIEAFLPEPDPAAVRKAEPKSSESISEPTTIDVVVAELAGIVGFDPGPYTLRELMAAAKSASSNRWDHTAMMLCQNANIHRDPKKAPYPLHRFHPFAAKEKSRGITASELHSYKNLFQQVTISGSNDQQIG